MRGRKIANNAADALKTLGGGSIVVGTGAAVSIGFHWGLSKLWLPAKPQQANQRQIPTVFDHGKRSVKR